MKKFIIFSLIMILFFGFEYDLFSETKIKNIMTVSVVRKDPGGPGVPSDCPDQGTGCTLSREVEIENIAIITSNPIGPGYILTGNIGTLEGEVIRSGNPETFNSTDKIITFPSGTSFQITECSEYPSLVNQIVPVGGITTNSSGNFTVQFIP